MFLERILQVLAPFNCLACGNEGSVLCQYCHKYLPPVSSRCYRCYCATDDFAVCQSCRRTSSLEKVWVYGEYDGLLQQIIKLTKFERLKTGASTLAEIIETRFSEAIAGYVIVPVPTTPLRQRQRGYDQAKLIAKQLAKRCGLPYQDLLLRSGKNRQLGAGRQTRLNQLHGVFHIRPNKLELTTPILLVDDVLTTGATLEEAARTLRKEGYMDISAMVIAHTVPYSKI